MGPSEIGYYTVKDGERSHRYLAWNPCMGCTAGCPTCYARRGAKRQRCEKCQAFTPHMHWEREDDPQKRLTPAMILANFQGDWMDKAFTGWETACVYLQMVTVGNYHTYITLTQHADRLRDVTKGRRPAPNIYHGVTITTQEQADKRLPDFLQIPGPKWISAEPLQEAIWPFDPKDGLRISGIIVGQDRVKGPPGTEGLFPIFELVDECKLHGVPVFVKQIWHEGKFLRASRPAEYALYPDDLKVTQLPWEGA